MKSPNYIFWKMAYENQWVSSESLKLAVITDSNPYGEITTAEYEEIVGVPFTQPTP